MHKLIFIVEEVPEGGYTARALGESIFTEHHSGLVEGLPLVHGRPAFRLPPGPVPSGSGGRIGGTDKIYHGYHYYQWNARTRDSYVDSDRSLSRATVKEDMVPEPDLTRIAADLERFSLRAPAYQTRPSDWPTLVSDVDALLAEVRRLRRETRPLSAHCSHRTGEVVCRV